MTMSLARGLTTINTKRAKRKPPTAKQLERYKVLLKAHNKDMRRMHCPNMQMTLDEYVDYCQGYYKPKFTSQSTSTYNTYCPPEVRETPNYPSLSNNMSGSTAKKEPMKYTGTLIKGIATMHKSNAVPIINKEEALDIARMRRG